VGGGGSDSGVNVFGEQEPFGGQLFGGRADLAGFRSGSMDEGISG